MLRNVANHMLRNVEISFGDMVRITCPKTDYFENTKSDIRLSRQTGVINRKRFCWRKAERFSEERFSKERVSKKDEKPLTDDKTWPTIYTPFHKVYTTIYTPFHKVYTSLYTPFHKPFTNPFTKYPKVFTNPLHTLSQTLYKPFHKVSQSLYKTFTHTIPGIRKQLYHNLLLLSYIR